VVFLILSSLLKIAAGRKCSFPSLWEGEYFHLGYSNPLIVSNSSISEKGECVWSSGSQYVVEGVESGVTGGRKERCWKCMSIYRKHANVLQYRESYCETYFDSFEDLCMSIAGDSPMYSMIRRDGIPESCPFHGPHTYSYAKGGSGMSCGYPRSYLDSCTDHTQLQLSYQACTDVQGSEAAAEQLTCLAGWKDGSLHYLVGAIDRQYVYTDEQRYRCFVYQYNGKGEKRIIKMAESGSATCRGLWSPQEGARVFEIKKVGRSASCRFPPWFTKSRSWTTINEEISIRIHSAHGFGLQNSQDDRNPEKSLVKCHSVKSTEPVIPVYINSEYKTSKAAPANYNKNALLERVVTYVKSGCDSGYVCMELNWTGLGVTTLILGDKSTNPAEACTRLYFSKSQQKEIILISPHESPQPCPLSGRYSLQPLAGSAWASGDTSLNPGTTDCRKPSYMHISAGCRSTSLEIESDCEDPNMNKTSLAARYSCKAAWSVKAQNFLVVQSDRSKRTFCLSYGDKTLSYSENECGDTNGKVFSMSETAPCLQALSSHPTSVSGGAVTRLTTTQQNTFLVILFILALHVKK